MEKNSSYVLIVDDLPVNRMILSSLLASRHVVSDLAESGYECLELCKKNDYDLILLDHRMPDLDGVDTLTELKELFREKGHAVPVICHTTEEGRKNINLYKAAGFADVLIKPVDPKELSDVIMTYLPEKVAGSDNDKKNDKTVSGTAEIATLDDELIKDELDKLPVWLKLVPHIDLVSGINCCGSAEDYIDALYIFRSSIDEKSEDIEGFLDDDDRKMYRLSVHSLKNMARLVGARSLADKAAALEELADNDNYDRIRNENPAMLSEYRKFNELLDPLMEDDDIMQIMSDSTERIKEENNSITPVDISKSILFIQDVNGIVTKGIEKNLSDLGYNVITTPDRPDAIINHRFDADIIIYYPTINEDSHIDLTMSILAEISQDDSKILCLTGDISDIELAMETKGAYRVSRTYPRPVDINDFMQDINLFSWLIKDFHRRKNVFIVDDDPDYLILIERWLSPSYNVSCFNNGSDTILGLTTVIPDLILMDYEMPEMNGDEVMKMIRKDSDTNMIPIIFLTGKNDRDHVYSILQYKPDGYLLKSSSKDVLIESIDRFFSETLFRKSL